MTGQEGRRLERTGFSPSVATLVLLILAIVPLAIHSDVAFAQGMDLRQAAGVPLPASDLPAGTVSVRVVRGSFANNLAGETVVFLVNGEERRATTDSSGRAQVDGLPRGARVSASVTVGAERLQSQDVTIADSGIRFVLVASDEGTSAAAAPAPAVPGTVFLGPDSRIVFDYSNELLNVYYVIHVVNPGQAPVDLGGPLVFDLPVEARSATPMEGITPQATVSGARATVVGPFAPGRTDVNLAFTLPFRGDTARFEQRWPVSAQPFAVFALRTGAMDMVSPQLTSRQSGTQQGQEIVMGLTTPLTPEQVLAIDITGLPHRSMWSRNLALGLAGIICVAGLWGAFGPGSRRRSA